MSDWVLIPCLKVLFAEFDRIAPSRDHASDGSIGDTAHQHEVSDHNPDETGSVPIHDADHLNEVHAIDVDDDLRSAGLTMEAVVQFLLDRCRRGLEKRLRYIIYNQRIWSASSGWVQKAYTGPSPHTEHAHFSASYTTALEADTSSWHLEDLMAASTDDILTFLQYDRKVLSNIQTALAGIAAAVKADQVDESAIVAGVLAGLSGAALGDAVIAAIKALPAETAAETVTQIRAAFAE